MPDNANGPTLLIVTVTKAVVCIVLVVTVSYCQIVQIPIEGTMERLIWAIVGVYFGISTLVYAQHRRNSHNQNAELWEELERIRKRARK